MNAEAVSSVTSSSSPSSDTMEGVARASVPPEVCEGDMECVAQPVTAAGDEQAPPIAAHAAADTARRLLHLNEIGLALSSERDIERLLALILTKARELTGADAGSLYIVEKGVDENGKDETTLFFRLSQNDSIQLHSKLHFPVSKSSLAGYAALTGEAIRCEDAYQLPTDAPYAFNSSWDRDNGYRTRSVLVVPMKNHTGAVIGVLQLINRKRRDTPLDSAEDCAREVIAFDAELAEVAAVLASHAAVALENNLLLQQVTGLLEEIEDTLESYVRASASLIDDRDPATAGHSERVTQLTLAMAQAASKAQSGPFAQVRFSPLQLQELSYAGLLHDVGKIGVRDYIFSKSHKLQPLHLEEVTNRIELRRRSRQLDCAREQLRCVRQLPPDQAQQTMSDFETELAAELALLAADTTLLRRANDPSISFLSDDEFAIQQAALHRLSELTYQTQDDQIQTILRPDEMASLSVRRGSLTPGERLQMDHHAQMSFDFLQQIRWNRDFERIPDIAYCHHEKLSGKGYPRGVTGEAISLQSRMMTVADIFDALTAADRVYKPAMPVEIALRILREEAARGDLDADVVELFIGQELYRVTSPKLASETPDIAATP